MRTATCGYVRVTQDGDTVEVSVKIPEQVERSSGWFKTDTATAADLRDALDDVLGTTGAEPRPFRYMMG